MFYLIFCHLFIDTNKNYSGDVLILQRLKCGTQIPTIHICFFLDAIKVPVKVQAPSF